MGADDPDWEAIGTQHAPWKEWEERHLNQTFQNKVLYMLVAGAGFALFQLNIWETLDKM